MPKNTPSVAEFGIQNTSPPGAPVSWQYTGETGSYSYCTTNGYQANCETEISNLGEQWVGLEDDYSWIDLEYDVVNAQNNYIGHFGISISHSAIKISNYSNVTVTLGQFKYGSPQSVTVSANIPPPPPPSCNFTGQINQNVVDFMFGGNDAGYTWGTSSDEIIPPTPCDVQMYYEKGFTAARVAIKLEYASTDGMTIDPNSPYMQSIIAHVENLVAHNFMVIVEPHNYMAYNGVTLTTQQCQQLVGNAFITPFVKMSNIIFEAMNEPPGGFNLDVLQACYEAIILEARSVGFTGLILLEGISWATPCAWTNADGTPSLQFQTLAPFFNNTALYGDVQPSTHNYWNSNTCGGTGLSECYAQGLEYNRIPQLTALAREYNLTFTITEMGMIITSTCTSLLNETTAYFIDNRDVWRGMFWWALTPDNITDWGGDGYGSGGTLLLEVDSVPVDPRYAIMRQYMINATEDFDQPKIAKRTPMVVIEALPDHEVETPKSVTIEEYTEALDELTVEATEAPEHTSLPVTSDASRPTSIFSKATMISGAAYNAIKMATHIISESLLTDTAENVESSETNSQADHTHTASGPHHCYAVTSTPEQPCFNNDGTTNIISTHGTPQGNELIAPCKFTPAPATPDFAQIATDSLVSGGTTGFLTQLFIDQGMTPDCARLASEGVTTAAIYAVSPVAAAGFFALQRVMNNTPNEKLGSHAQKIKTTGSIIAAAAMQYCNSGFGLLQSLQSVAVSSASNYVGRVAGNYRNIERAVEGIKKFAN